MHTMQTKNKKKQLYISINSITTCKGINHSEYRTVSFSFLFAFIIVVVVLN